MSSYEQTETVHPSAQIHPRTFFRSLLTLSLSQNLLSKFPLDLVDNLPALAWLRLRGNYIETLPQQGFMNGPRKRLDKVDLGENFITSVPRDMFNGTLTVNDLTLVRNFERCVVNVLSSALIDRKY